MEDEPVVHGAEGPALALRNRGHDAVALDHEMVAVTIARLEVNRNRAEVHADLGVQDDLVVRVDRRRGRGVAVRVSDRGEVVTELVELDQGEAFGRVGHWGLQGEGMLIASWRERN